MLVYVEICKAKYVKGKEVDYAKCVLAGIIANERKDRIVVRATEALLDLTKQGNCPVLCEHILNRTQFERYGAGKCGLWPWMYAEIVDKTPGKKFLIRQQCYDAMQGTIFPLLKRHLGRSTSQGAVSNIPSQGNNGS